MFLLRSSVAALAGEIAAGTLVPRLTEQFRHGYGYLPSPTEVRSWERSIPAAIKEFRAAGLDELEVLVEWQLPLTSKRVDLALLGQHPRGGPSCVLIENKQWSRAELEDPAYRMVIVDGVGGRERLHPQEQVRGYVEYLQDFNKYLSAQPAAVAGMVLLHNATSLSIASLRAPELADLAAFPMFTADDSAAAQAFLRSRLAPTAAPQVADDVLHSAIGPSKQLLDYVSEEIRTGDQYTLLDEQRAAFEVVLRAVERSRRGDHKQAIIVTGGPGSGKSVIAITLLAELAKQGLNIAHATGSRSFTTTLREVVGRRERRVKALFRYFNVFGQAEPNSLDVLLADEAHRIRETSNYRFTPAAKRSSIPQVDELIRAARVPVFLLDEHQGVRPGEIGRVAEIRAAADRNNLDVYEIDLDGQFRCAGSPGYLLWVKRLLGLEPGGPIPWNPDDPFRLAVVDSPERLEQVLAQRLEEGYGARMAAGFCWKWSDPNPDRTLVDDVVIGDWQRPWNLRSDRPLGDIPSSSLWATDPAGFGQVGCIYTAQGFEYEWAGVIIGPDLVWRGDHWQTNPAASADKELRRAPNFDILVRNVYKVLLTRGLIGCVLYSTDPETQALLTRLGIPSKARLLDDVASTAPIRGTPHREPAFPGTGEQTSQAPPADRSRASSIVSVPSESVVEEDAELQPQGTVFISYCHKDRRWLQRLLVHLKPLERQGVLNIWEDSRIEPGTPWREEIRKALDAARLAVLLVSADFLASDFIMDDELPTLLKSAEERGTIVIPLIVAPSRFSRTISISRYQAINSPDLPLMRLAGYQREELLVRLANSIEEALRNRKVVS